MTLPQRLTPFYAYLVFIDFLGILILLLGASQIATYANPLNFFLLIGLAIVAAMAPIAAAA